MSKRNKKKLKLKGSGSSPFTNKELSSVTNLERLVEAGEFASVKKKALKSLYHDLSSDLLKERAVFLAAFSQAKMGEFKAASELIEKHQVLPNTLDRAYLNCYLSLKLADPEKVVTFAAQFLRLNRGGDSSGTEKINRSCQKFEYEIHNNAGLAYQIMGQKSKALRELRLAVDKNPEHLESVTNLISLLYEFKEYEAALNIAKSAKERFPEKPQIQSVYGILLFATGEYQESKSILERLVADYPDSADAISNLAVVYEKEGDFETARNYFSKALELDPNHRNTLMNLFRLEVDHFEKRPTISLCMIVKDEEDNIARCINSIKDVVDQMVVVDTGSSDRTPDIAKELGAEVYFHPWKNSFSEARNNSIKYASGDWIIYLDADEELFEEDRELLLQAARNTTCTAVSVQIFNPLQGELEGFLRYTRMWRNRMGFYFDGIVHNQLIFDGLVFPSKIRVRHYGYGYDDAKMAKKYDRSEKLLLQQIEENPKNTFALFNLAQIKRGKRELDDVIKYASRVVDIVGPTNKKERHTYLMALDQLCSACFFKGDMEMCINYGMQALKIKPDYFDPMLTIGSAYINLRKYDEGLKYYKMYLEAIENFDPDNDHSHIIYNNLGSQHFAYYGMGVAMKDLGRYNEAEKYFREAAEREPNHLKVHCELGLLAYKRRDFQTAKDEFQRDLSFNPESFEACYMLGKIASDEEDPEKAISYYEKSIAINPEQADSHLALAEIMIESNDFISAKKHIDLVLDIHPEYSDAYRLRGNINFEMGEFRSALSDYEKYIENNPQDYLIMGNLANCYLRLEEFEKALELYRKVISIKPDYDIGYLNLAVCYKNMKRWKEAASAFLEYYNINPVNNKIFIQIADCLVADNQIQHALGYYEKYLAVYPQDYLALYKLAESYRLIGATDAAIVGYRGVLKINPDFEPARQMLQHFSTREATVH
ncbi:MAG: tetratricopeptide repeat protein [candidate division Zixibacteria bacterium]|nr:tetratricopeptide repeat protein [candidate division Zixibacteria bacterium]